MINLSLNIFLTLLFNISEHNGGEKNPQVEPIVMEMCRLQREDSSD